MSCMVWQNLGIEKTGGSRLDGSVASRMADDVENDRNYGVMRVVEPRAEVRKMAWIEVHEANIMLGYMMCWICEAWRSFAWQDTCVLWFMIPVIFYLLMCLVESSWERVFWG
jgi:hypothetical protein